MQNTAAASPTRTSILCFPIFSLLRYSLIHSKDKLETIWFKKDGRLKTLSYQMRYNRAVQNGFLCLCYLIARLSVNKTGKQQILPLLAAGTLAVGIVRNENPMHAIMCAIAGLAYTALLHAYGFQKLTYAFFACFVLAASIWAYWRFVLKKHAPPSTENYFVYLEWILTLTAIVSGLYIAGLDKDWSAVRMRNTLFGL